MASVFVIESGSYSDRHIYGIFSTSEKAEEYDKLVPESSGVQEWPLDTITTDQDSLLVVMAKDGSVYNMQASYVYPFGFEGYNYPFETPDVMLLWIVGTYDVLKAVKTVNEKRIQILAMNLWGNGEGTREYFSV